MNGRVNAQQLLSNNNNIISSHIPYKYRITIILKYAYIIHVHCKISTSHCRNDYNKNVNTVRDNLRLSISEQYTHQL